MDQALTCANEEKPSLIWSRGALAIGIDFPIIAAILLPISEKAAVLSLRTRTCCDFCNELSCNGALQ